MDEPTLYDRLGGVFAIAAVVGCACSTKTSRFIRVFATLGSGTMVDKMITAGASALSIAAAGEWTTRVLRDPAGNEFCVIGPD